MVVLQVTAVVANIFAMQSCLSQASRKMVSSSTLRWDEYELDTDIYNDWEQETIHAFDPTFICAAWKVSEPKDLGMVTQGGQMFHKTSKFVRLVSKPKVIGSDTESSSVEDSTENFNIKAGLEADVKFFTGEIQGEFNSALEEHNYFYRTDREVYVQRAEFSIKSLNPPAWFLDETKYLFDTWEPPEISERIGDFWATHVLLGGRLLRRITVTTNKQVSSTEVYGKISAEMDKAAFKIGGEAEVDLEWSDSSVESRSYTYFQVIGGTNLTMWFSFTGDNFDKIQQEWAHAMQKDADVDKGYGMVEITLKPIWTLIDYFNRTKANQVKEWYEKKWQQEAEEQAQWEAEKQAQSSR